MTVAARSTKRFDAPLFFIYFCLIGVGAGQFAYSLVWWGQDFSSCTGWCRYYTAVDWVMIAVAAILLLILVLIMTGNINNPEHEQHYSVATMISSVVLTGLAIAWVVNETKFFITCNSYNYYSFTSYRYGDNMSTCHNVMGVVNLVLGWVLFFLSITLGLLAVLMLVRLKKAKTKIVTEKIVSPSAAPQVTSAVV